MRWLAATLTLIGASFVLLVGIYLRDRDPSWLPPPRMAADFDARMVLTNVAGPGCGQRCSYQLLGNPRHDHWLAQIVDRSRTQCVDINLPAFGVSEGHGISGVTRVDCDSGGPG